jgi:hypothetical protein
MFRNTIGLPFVLCGCKIWSFTLREKHRLRAFENRVLRKIFAPKTEEAAGGWRENYINRNFTICTPHQI